MNREFMDIAQKLALEIKKGVHTDTLPSISRLSAQYGVCPATIKHTLTQLRSWKLVSGEHGRCVRVNPKAAGNPYFHKNVVFLSDLTSLATPVFSKILEQLSSALCGSYICIHVFLSENQVQECEFTPDCAVVINNHMSVILEQLLKRFPACGVIMLNVPSNRYPFVMGDGRKAGCEAIRHLAEDCGHTHIGVLATQLQYPTASFARRCEGALSYARRHPGIKISVAEIPELELTGQACFRLMGELKAKDPQISAVFATCDMLAFGAYSYALDNHLRIPEDLAVIGFDNMDFCSALTPRLSTLSENTQEMARCLFDLIRNILMGNKVAREHYTEPLLLARDSTRKREDNSESI